MSLRIRRAFAADPDPFEWLPGYDLVRQGLDDLEQGRESVDALLVAIGAPRLRRIGVSVPARTPSDPEHRLYELLRKADSDSAHGRYTLSFGG